MPMRSPPNPSYSDERLVLREQLGGRSPTRFDRCPETNARWSKSCPKILALFHRRAGASLGHAGRTARAGTGVEIAALLHQQFRQPSDCRPRTRHVGDKAKPSVPSWPTALLFEWNTLQTRLFQRATLGVMHIWLRLSRGFDHRSSSGRACPDAT